MDMAKIAELQQMIDDSSHIVFFGGAGTSTESGIKDFRGEDGLYSLGTKYHNTTEIQYLVRIF